MFKIKSLSLKIRKIRYDFLEKYRIFAGCRLKRSKRFLDLKDFWDVDLKDLKDLKKRRYFSTAFPLTFPELHNMTRRSNGVFMNIGNMATALLLFTPHLLPALCGRAVNEPSRSFTVPGT